MEPPLNQHLPGPALCRVQEYGGHAIPSPADFGLIRVHGPNKTCFISVPVMVSCLASALGTHMATRGLFLAL
jgi:hypothetical protein